ncbi:MULTISPECIES: nitrite reductase large subunit NirB [Enterobacter]|uniref:Nitrite reductase [NAD(P)H] large subunit n=1 Tax=Enterobacter asburiae TaxID=61645 RepID=A0ABC9U5F4_ENTAS|nr:MULTISPECIES: nitrite reductase large subunit NirB [Enterobacter]AZL65768.1 nitrite reductase small subunit NirD [Enterobacter asburiae]EHF5039061.1 nitrite reductase small subunit NirD [Enterobacter asburiae]EMB8993844.1 nitrite reductase small subunit NirD [Enterobacter asburiae]ESM27377.1 nitrite reductase [NAD(P)H] large subunit [Enterobacter asburiae]MCK6900020.1 nitrite reductase large subunit NirB [Enterobacter asburiae]
MRLVIIGNGMAATRLIASLTGRAADRFAITVIGDEPEHAYNRIQLSPVLGGEKQAADICLQGDEWYQSRGVTVLRGEKALAVNVDAREVQTTARTLGWDALVYATGSTPSIPPIPGCDAPHVFTFRTLADTRAIQAIVGPAVVLGGGVLGVEAAAALARSGDEVTLVHRGPWLMEQQLDRQAGMLLEEALAARGVRCELVSGIAAVNGDSVTLLNGRSIAAARVVLATGVQPSVTLAQASGIRCARGIVVDRQMQTSEPDVYAIGECCEIDGQTFGLVAPCLAQADILAARLAGDVTAPFTLTDSGMRLKVTGVELFSLGRAAVQEGDVVWSAWDPLTRHYRRLLINQEALAGVLLMGDCRSAATFTDLLATAAPAHADWLFDRFTTQPQVAGHNAMTKPTLVVVGHGMVGHHFLEDCVNRNLHQQYQIVVFGEERYAAYDRVHLSEYFGGRSAASLSLVEGDFFVDNGIELRLSQQVVAIDRDARVVRTASGHETHWDKLVLATGSYPFVPPVPGNDLPGCFVYRTLDDLDNIAAHAAGSRRGVVIGGGLLGLEAANALKQLGLETHLVEFAPNLMAVQLDNDGAAMLRKKIEALGVGVHTSKATTEIATADSGLVLRFADGEQLETDMVVFSAGIRPQDALARSSGLAIGERGGICIDDGCRTSDPDVLAIGECALWEGKIFGLVAPGYQMARVAAAALAGEDKTFTGADMSTKLKLLGVDVASFGDAHGRTPGALSYQWTHGPQQIYKKIVVSHDGKTLLGGVLVGDASEYATLVQMMLNGIALPKEPETLILPASSGSAPKALGVAALPESAQICSCHNVSKGDICRAVSAGATDIGAVKQCTKAATGCGGCSALVKQVMEFQLAEQGVEVKKDICEHFPYSRQEIYHLVRVNHIRTFDQLISRYGQGHGCEICKPLVGSVLASCWNEYLLKPAHLPLQDTNDRYFANIQKDGTYSIVPRMPAGEVTADGLIAIGQIAKRYSLYSKITGGQRIDLFGATLEQLPEIWQALVEAGFETGHAYGKSLRTVKSCVGSTWCRYGVQDSTGLAVRLEHRYKGLRAPHKIKMAVSGCTRECAEAQSKDVGVIATDKGWNLYLCGNGGMKPRHADLFASDLDDETLIRTVDRFLMFYIRTADRLQRTSTWMDNLEGGLDYLREVILNDSLGIAHELEQEMARVVETYQCEWQTTLSNPNRLALFRTTVNETAPDESKRWQEICGIDDIPEQAGIGARLGRKPIALFRFGKTVYALDDREPGGEANVLSRGILGDASGEPVVISPLYKQRIRLRDGCQVENGEPAVRAWPVKIENGKVWVGSDALVMRAEAS